MGRRFALRPDDDARARRGLAGRSNDAARTRRLLAVAAIHDGASRSAPMRLQS